MTRQTLVHLALRGQLPAEWRRCGGADADMAGVLWTDTAGVTYVGEDRTWDAPIPDPCTWVAVPETELGP